MDCLRDGFEHGKPLDNGRFLTVAPLNHGSFGMVFTARDTLTGQDVAIKCITKAGAVQNTNCPAAIATDERSEELAIHSRLPLHPNIVNFVHTFETDAHQYMVLELCSNGDLYEAIRSGRGPLETEHVRDFMLQLVESIDHLHSNGVYHRDIKPENIFLTTSGSMKLGDFGLATTETWSTEFAVGSDRYMAPEQFDASVYGYGYSPASADVWAIGIVMLNVLFQRNPFLSPTMKDPLFADFARDRQSLFDVFPNLSQDTYNVLVHSLALDPANRSLGAVREALKAAVSFTTDDEALDDFCTEQDGYVPMATAAREPLRTPSITSPNMTGDSFPWSTALLKTPQKNNERQLSTIHDEEVEPELFPGSVKSDWHYVDTDEASLSSALDSGLGMSYKSAKSVKSTNSKPASTSNFVGSLPISFTRRTSKSPYGANGFSKSWSDLWDEEEEELEQQARSSFEMDVGRVDTVKPSTPQLNTIVEDDRGSVTPRQALAETDANSRGVSPLRKLIEQDKANEKSNPEFAKQRSSSILDKWAILGNFRRATKQEDSTPSSTATATPTQQKTNAFATFTPFSTSKKLQQQPQTTSKSRGRSGSWRQGSPQRLRSSSMNNSKVWERKEPSPTHPPTSGAWARDNNWREHKPRSMDKSSPPLPKPSPTRQPVKDPQRKPQKNFLDYELDDIGDLEWVGGWHDFQEA